MTVPSPGSKLANVVFWALDWVDDFVVEIMVDDNELVVIVLKASSPLSSIQRSQRI